MSDGRPNSEHAYLTEIHTRDYKMRFPRQLTSTFQFSQTAAMLTYPSGYETNEVMTAQN